MSNEEVKTNESVQRKELEFVDVTGLKWTRNGQIMAVIDRTNEKGNKLAIGISKEFLCKALGLKPLELVN